MFYIVTRIVDKYGVIDTDDGVIEYLTLDGLKDAVAQGLTIEGWNNGSPKKAVCTLPSNLCNWAGGQNVFEVGSSFRMDKSGKFKFKAGKKEFKGQAVIPENGGNAELTFTIGVKTSIPVATLKAMKER